MDTGFLPQIHIIHNVHNKYNWNMTLLTTTNPPQYNYINITMFIPRTLPRCSLLRRPSPSMPSDGSTQACGPSPQSLSRGCTELQCAPLYRLLPPGMCHPLPDISLYWKINMFQAEQSAPFHPFIDLLAASDVCLSVRQYSADPLNEINCIARMSRGNPYISAVSINFSSEQLSFS